MKSWHLAHFKKRLKHELFKKKRNSGIVPGIFHPFQLHSDQSIIIKKSSCFRGKQGNIADSSAATATPGMLASRSDVNVSVIPKPQIPNIADMYILQSCVNGTFSTASSFFITQIVQLLSQGYDIETIQKKLGEEAKVQIARVPGTNDTTFQIPEATTTLVKDFYVRPYNID